MADIITGAAAAAKEPGLLTKIYEDMAQPSIQAVGKGLGAVADLAMVFRYPLNCVSTRCQMYFDKNIKDYAKKLESIPEEKICEAHPQIGVPIVEKLSYTTNEDIADMFTTLLANASSQDRVGVAHPYFVQMIERLTPDEAKIIKYIKETEQICYCNFNVKFRSDSKKVMAILKHGTAIAKNVDLMYGNNVSVYITNILNMGIIEDTDRYSLDMSNYEDIKEFYGFEVLKKDYASIPDFKDIAVTNRKFEITPLGRLFVDACTNLK